MTIELEIDSQTMSKIETLKQASNRSTAAEVLLDALRLYDWAREQVEQRLIIGAVKDGRVVKTVTVPLRPSSQAS